MAPLTRRRLLERLGSATTFAATTGSVALAGCSASGNAPTVRMPEFSFTPRTLRIGAGTTVEWINDSDVEHTVTAYADRIPADAAYFASGDFDSERAARNHLGDGLVAPGDTYRHTIDTPGTYAYYCIPHESSGMRGEIVVK